MTMIIYISFEILSYTVHTKHNYMRFIDRYSLITLNIIDMPFNSS